MRRGTTPSITVNLDVDASTVDVLFLTIKQGTTIIEKTLADASINGKSAMFPLSQSDTLALSTESKAHIQVRGRVGGHAFASAVSTVDVALIIKDGEI